MRKKRSLQLNTDEVLLNIKVIKKYITLFTIYIYICPLSETRNNTCTLLSFVHKV